MSKLNLLSLALIVLIAGCAASRASRGSANPKLEHTRWVLTTLKGRPITDSDGAHQSYIELQPSQIRFVGDTGVNPISGTYTKTGQTLRFSIESVFKTVGSDEAMVQERDLLQVLALTETYRIDRRELSLLVDDQVAALFVAR